MLLLALSFVLSANAQVNIHGGGDFRWQAPVPTAALLPVAGNVDGTERVALDTKALYSYDFSSGNWLLQASPAAATAITALIGDVQATGPGAAASTIQPGVVTNSKLAQAPAMTLKGNNTGALGNVSDLSVSDVRTQLAITNVDNTSDATKNSAVATLTNKTISGSSNTLTNIANTSLTNSQITINGSPVSLGGSITVSPGASSTLTIGTGLSGTSYNGTTPVTIAVDSTVATLTGSQTLTNKSLTSPVLTGNPTAPTQSPGDNSTKISTTAYADAGDALKLSKSANLSDVSSAPTSRINLGVDKRTTFSNADYTALSTDKYIAQIGTLSATRTVTLPAASSVNPGYEIIVNDESGTVSATNMIIVQRSGSDAINLTTSVNIATPNADRRFFSDGASKWFTDRGVLRPANNLSDVASAPTALTNIGAEAVANKSTSTALGASTTLYPSQSAVLGYAKNNLAALGRETVLFWEGGFGGTTISQIGLGATITGGSARAYVDTTSFSRRSCTGIFTGASAGSVVGIKPIALVASLNTGFNFTVTIAPAGTNGATRLLAALTQNISLITNVEPTTLINAIGLAKISTSNNWGILTNDGTGTATFIDLGPSFDATNINPNYVMLQLTADPGATSVNYVVTNLDTGVVVSGTLTSDLPVASQGLAPQVAISNNTSAVGELFDFASMALRVSY